MSICKVGVGDFSKKTNISPELRSIMLLVMFGFGEVRKGGCAGVCVRAVVGIKVDSAPEGCRDSFGERAWGTSTR